VAAVLLSLHLLASLLLALYGGHRFLLAVRYRRSVARAPRPPRLALGRLPAVTVQVPIYNERYVATRAIEAAAALDYPRSLLEIQVLDDSTDETSTLVAAVARDLRADGVRVEHIRRGRRTGYKAGALAHGLGLARGELLAVFDADFVPRADFLRRVVGEFADPTVGMVQARWGHLNARTSLLTRVQALQLDAHFTVEHGVRQAAGCFFNFNGTAGIWRKRAIVGSGGWCPETLTEDLDLSYRAQLAGWRFIYRDDVEVSAELPVEIAGYRLQQQRWAQGGSQTAIKLLPSILDAPLSWRVKLEALWHLTGHFSYPLLIVLAAAGVLASVWSGSGYRPWLVTLDTMLVAFATLALSVFYGVAAHARGTPRWWRRVGLVGPIMILGAGIAVGQAAAVTRGVLKQRTPFRRTPKYRQEEPHDRSWRTAAYRISTLKPALVELVLGLVILGAGVLAGMYAFAYPSGPLFLIGAGFAATGATAATQHPLLATRRGKPRPDEDTIGAAMTQVDRCA
jgi:cellulose synthase/poly-beta-1,6-N-acetylglucosamine synthase-like glycosyltransferase